MRFDSIEAAQQLQEPAILLYRGNGLISTLIKWQTRGVYSHAAFLLPDGSVLESREGEGVQLLPSVVSKQVDIYRVVGMTPAQWEKALFFARAQLGKRYDWLAIARFISRRHYTDNSKWFCSELVFESLQSAGIDVLERIESWAVSPQLLALSPMLEEVVL